MSEVRVKRPPGSGSVEYDKRRKTFRARVRVPGQKGKITLDTFTREEDAHQALDAYFLDRAARDGESAGRVTLRTITERFFHQRELAGVRGVGIERNRWDAHILGDALADWPLDEITSRNVREFRDRLQKKKATRVIAGGTKLEPKRGSTGRIVSRSTVKNTLNLLRAALGWAVEEDLIESNQAYGIKIKKDLRTDDPWSYLTPAEQHSLLTCEAIPLPERLIIQFAIGTGMRKGEIWCLRRADVHERGDNPQVFVRYGSPGKPPKSGRTRWVPLTPIALDAVTQWLALLPKYARRNPLGLMFPTRRGHRRWRRIFRAEVRGADGARTGTTMRWPDMLHAAGIARRVRFHDLRHTCGSSLVAGWWGDPWPLINVRDFLGHAQISTTERYAHLAVSALAKAARSLSDAGPQLARNTKLDAIAEEP
jgi:integrase